MTTFVHELISQSAQRSPEAIALQVKGDLLNYAQLNESVKKVAKGYLSLAINQNDRIGIYLAKNHKNVQSIFACSVLGAVFVPINPVLKAPQVLHIVNDCQIKLLITNRARLKALKPILDQFTDLKTVVLIDATDESDLDVSTYTQYISVISWQTLIDQEQDISKVFNNATAPTPTSPITPITRDPSNLAAILYTSGSTGNPKGIMLSHTNIVLGAKSVSQYLEQTADDIILAVLPLSFDYGLNQLTSCFLVGAQCVLLDYLFANDVINAITKYKITGLAAVPPLWQQLTKVTWPKDCANSIRYFTNSGGVLPLPTLSKLQILMPQAKPYLMYGLTESFRSTYLSPFEVSNRPTSMGKAIPYAEILVLREDGIECDNNEVGELVHIGPLVSLGYWQNEIATQARFKPAPEFATNAQNIPLAVFSGDYVTRDKDDFLYFVSRKDAMIKTSGYRVSPTELESVLLEHPHINEAAVIARSSEKLGQEIIALVVGSATDEYLFKQSIIKHCQLNLANYMIPKEVIVLDELPRNANGKVDSKRLTIKYS